MNDINNEIDERAISKGDINIKKYKNYYDVSDTITTALATNPNNPDSASYNSERIFGVLQRNAEELTVVNDGSDTLYVIISHNGETNLSQEVPIYPKEAKIYYNIFQLLLRSATVGLPYRVTEYKICCNTTDGLNTVVPATNSIIQGTTTGITTVAAQITATSTPIYKVVTVKVRSLGTGTWIALGNSTAQPFRLTAVKDSIDIDWTDNLNKVYVITDAGNTGVLEWIGG